MIEVNGVMITWEQYARNVRARERLLWKLSAAAMNHPTQSLDIFRRGQRVLRRKYPITTDKDNPAL